MSAGLPGDPASGRNRPEVEAAFAAVPEGMVAEILDGELFTFPRPARPHTRSKSRLGMKLGGPFDLGDGGPGGWVILDEPELHLGRGPDVLDPDLAGWRREHLPDAFGSEEDTKVHIATVQSMVKRVLYNEGNGHRGTVRATRLATLTSVPPRIEATRRQLTRRTRRTLSCSNPCLPGR